MAYLQRQPRHSESSAVDTNPSESPFLKDFKSVAVDDTARETVSSQLNSCLECFEVVRFSRDLEENHRDLIHRFFCLGLTLARWGYSKGLVSSSDSQKRYDWIIRKIYRKFERARVVSNELKHTDPIEKQDHPSSVAFEEELDPTEASFRDFFRYRMHQYAMKYESRRTKQTETWTIHDRGVLKLFIWKIRMMLDEWVKLLPEHVEVPTNELIDADFKEAPDIVLEILQKASSEDGAMAKFIREAIVTEINRRKRAVSSLQRSEELYKESSDEDVSQPPDKTKASPFDNRISIQLQDTYRSQYADAYTTHSGETSSENPRNKDRVIVSRKADEHYDHVRALTKEKSQVHRLSDRLKYTDFQNGEPGSLEGYKRIAADCRRGERWVKAERLQRKILEISIATFGKDDPRTLASMIDLSSILKIRSEKSRSLDRTKEADALEDQVRKSVDELLHTPTASDLIGLDELVLAYRNYERWDEAIEIEHYQFRNGEVLKLDQYLAQLLLEDPSLREKYVEALRELGTERFYKFHDQALSEFFTQLNLEDLQSYRPFHLPITESRRTDISDRMLQLMEMESQSWDLELARRSTLDFKPNLVLLTRTRAFEILKRTLDSLLDTDFTIESNLQYKNIEVFRRMLERGFELVARDQYSWLHELSEVGYTYDEIAELLFEQVVDAPWIVFEPRVFESAKIEIGFHLYGCIHQYVGIFANSSGCSNCSTVLHELDLIRSRSMSLQSVSARTQHDVKETVEKLCGIAGVTPRSRNRLEWGGIVNFTEENTVATVSYAKLLGHNGKEDAERMKMVGRIKASLERFCLAAAKAQAAELCCDSFTIVRLRRSDCESKGAAESVIEVCRIELQLAQQLLENIDYLDAQDNSKIRSTALTILQQITNETEKANLSEEGDVLHICALAAQILCLGFVSYMQAHAGHLRPCVLDTPLKKVQLLGIGSTGAIALEASLQSLTCFNGVVQSPIFTFTTIEPASSLHLPLDQGHTYDLLATIEDLIDTWGPAQLLNDSVDSQPFAVKIGGGTIYAEDARTTKLHWSSDASPESMAKSYLDLSKKYLIGTRVTANATCKIIDFSKCHQNSSASLVPLGTYRPCWIYDERQVGLQGGQYLNGSLVFTSHKLPGRTLKQQILDQHDERLMGYLDELWGVQVSFCTHVARRVPLREMVADLLPEFVAASATSCDDETWEKLGNLQLLEILRKGDINEFLRKLCATLHEKLVRMIRHVFEIVQHTGLDREKKNFIVAWPHKSGIFKCFQVPLKEQNLWIEVLADSQDSAAFCYISSKCLETDKIKCNGPEPVWNREMPLLETAVMVHERDRAALAAMLKHGKFCYFQKMDDLFVVRVQRPVADGVVNLITKRSILPPAIRVRLMAKDGARLRERIGREDPAEEVAVSYLPISVP